MSVHASNELLEAGVRARASGRMDETAALYQQAPAAHPDNARALCNLGHPLHQLGESERAEAMLERALRLKTCGRCA